MLIAHNIIDILRAEGGTVGGRTIMRVPGISTRSCRRMIAELQQAQKFDFGTLTLELLEGRPGNGKYALPTLTEEERGFWLDNLIPLPYPVCWYEFTLGGSRTGMLVRELNDDQWSVERIDYTQREIVFDSVQVVSSRSVSREQNSLHMEAIGNEEFLSRIRKNEVFMENNLAAAVPLAIYFTLMLNSQSTDVTLSLAPERLNLKRAKAGRTPLEDHRIVTIVPERYRAASEEEAKGTHRPPRLHWRRSHMRHYDHHTLRSKWAPSVVHDGKQGWWIAVIARQLVGRADLGEVSHEYRIGSREVREEAA